MIEYIAITFPDANLAGWTGPGWYFWDEAQSSCIGPFGSKAECERAAKHYGDQL